MSNNKTLMTAEETFTKVTGCIINHKDVKQAMIEFAKLHVEAALKAVNENAKVILDKDWVRKEQTIYPNQLIAPITIKVYEESILNAYPLNNIK